MPAVYLTKTSYHKLPSNYYPIMLKNLAISSLIILALLSIYFGSYLPFVKSRRFIKSLRTADSVKTLDQFKTHFDKVFKFYSPVGDEEVTKFLSNDIATMISQTGQSEEIARALVGYIEPYLLRNNVRHLLMGARFYSILWNHFRKVEDVKRAEDYYLAAFKIGPKLPPVLYGMLEFYRAIGNREKYEEIARLIITYWPNGLPATESQNQ